MVSAEVLTSPHFKGICHFSATTVKSNRSFYNFFALYNQRQAEGLHEASLRVCICADKQPSYMTPIRLETIDMIITETVLLHLHHHSIRPFSNVRQVRIPRPHFKTLPSYHFHVWISSRCTRTFRRHFDNYDNYLADICHIEHLRRQQWIYNFVVQLFQLQCAR